MHHRSYALNLSVSVLGLIALSLSSLTKAAEPTTTAIATAQSNDVSNEKLFGPERHEIDSGSAGMLRFRSGTDAQYMMYTGYHFRLLEALQVSNRTAFEFDSTNTLIQTTFGPTLNYPVSEPRLSDSFFLHLGAGVRWSKSTSKDSTWGFAYIVEMGKRITLLKNVQFKPMFRISGATSSVLDPNVDFIPLHFSIFLE
jgi:hypothetical protein